MNLVRRHTAAHGTRVGITPKLKTRAVPFLDFIRDQGLEAGDDTGPAVPLHVQAVDLATVLAVRQQMAAANSAAHEVTSRPLARRRPPDGFR